MAQHDFPFSKEFSEDTPKVETKTTDQIIMLIGEVLSESDERYIEQIANQILTEKVTYVKDSLFEVTNNNT